MTRQRIFAALFALLLLCVGDAFAVDEGAYPHTIIDTNCTNTNDTVGWGANYVESSGSANALCDHDNRIRQTAITADTTYGPFKMPPGTRGLFLFVQPDVVSNDTDTWRFQLITLLPHDGAEWPVGSQGSQSTEGNKVVSFAPGEYADPASTGVTNVDVAVPRTFYLKLDLTSATSWAGSLSWYAY